MPGNAPPFPVESSPHIDIAIRELYARLMRLERVLRVSTPSGAPAAPSVGVSKAVVVQMANCSLVKVQGWWQGIPRHLLPSDHADRGGAPQLLTNLDAPGVVLDITAYLIERFVGVDEPNAPDVVITDFATKEVTEGSWTEFWGRIDRNSVNGSGWAGSSVPVIEAVSRPSPWPLDGLWRQIGVPHASRKPLGRSGMTTLSYLPIVVGFRTGEPGAAAQSTAEPAGTEVGKLHFLAVYSEGVTKNIEPVPVRELGTYVLGSGRKPILLSELGVKAA